MSDKDLDARIKETFLKMTDHPVKTEDEIWGNIEKAIDNEHIENENTRLRGIDSMSKTNKKLSKVKWIISGAVAASLAFAFVTTPTGHAIMTNIKEIFVPEKKVVEDIEGTPEESEVSLQEGTDYIIYFDEEMYKKVIHEGKDRIVPLTVNESLPEIYMEIEQDIDRTPEEVAGEIEDQLKNEFATVHSMEEVQEPIKALHIRGIGGNKWNSPVVAYYVVSNEKGGSFIIKQQYFMEASEGYGARFYYMLKEFKVVESDSDK